MATTESLTNKNLLTQSDPDTMEIGASPYPLTDDIEFDLEEDAHYVDDNSMIDDAPASMDPMQAENPIAQSDDYMYDETYDEEIVYQDDLDMNGGNDDIVEQHEFDEENSHDTNIHIDDHIPKDSQDRPVDVDREEQHHDLPVHEETTNAQNYSSLNLDEPGLETADQVDTAGQDVEDDRSTTLAEPADVLDTKNHITNAETATSPQNTIIDEIDQARKDSDQTDLVAASVEVHEDELDQSAILGLDVQKSDGNADQATDLPDPFLDPRSPTPAEIHPVTVEYGGVTYWLFPNRVEGFFREVLLEDPALALLPINSLLKALHHPVADYLGHEDEIVLDIRSLGLHICEDSKYAAELTLSQIIDTYMLLSQNQGLGHIEPLHCELSHRTCLRTQMQYLVHSARGGKTYADMSEEHLGSTEEQESLHEVSAFDNLADDEETFDDSYEDDAGEETYPVTGQEGQLSPAHDATAEEVDLDENIVDEAGLSLEDHREPDAENESGEVVDRDHGEPADVLEDRVDFPNDDVSLLEKETSDSKLDDQHDPAPALPTDDLEEEDLFTDEIFNTEPTGDTEEFKLEEDATTRIQTHTDDAAKPVADENDELDFDEWDNEDPPEPQKELVPVTPSKSVNGKRKVDDDEEELDLDLTPQPKKSRSS